MFASAIPMTLLIQPAQAQLSETQPVSGELPSGVTTNVTVATEARLSFRPNPVGVGQTILVNIWTNPGTNVQRMHEDYKVTITDPDGNEDVITLDSYCADATAWFEYVVDQVGTWKLKFDFAGTYFPAGQYYKGYIVTNSSGEYVESSYYKPSSTGEQELVVQDESVSSWPASALPTDYWTRPINPENREWWVIGGNYPWSGPATSSLFEEIYPDTNPYWSNSYKFTPWVQAPNTAHIVWKEVGQVGAGLIGGDNGIYSYYPERARPGTPSIILSGRAFQSYSKPGSGTTAVTYWKCYDIRTGELFWERPLAAGESAPTAICYESGLFSVAGADNRASLTATLVYIGGGHLLKYDPWTGALTYNVSIAPLTTSTYYMNGYALGIQNLGGGNYRLINWTTTGSSTTLASRIVSNTTYALSSIPSLQDWNTCLGATVSAVTQAGAWTGTKVTGYDLLTGEALWTTTVDEALFSQQSASADHGKVAVVTMAGHWLAWDIRTGKLAWTSPTLDYPWDASGFGSYGTVSAYGLLYWSAYMAQYAINWSTGEIAWKYQYTSVPYETPYSGYVSFRGYPIVADGKIYAYNDEHSPTAPVTRGWSTFCLNAITGEPLWNITGSLRPYAVADGYLVGASMYDDYMYVFGKGTSATTVTAGPKAITLGESVVVEGTVLDQSPAQSGTPCVSADSMSTQMEYLHMQRPIDGLWHNLTMTGVSVSLDTVDPNGNYVHIGDVTTDAYSGTFGFAWDPEVPGQYAVTATFMGDDSYGSSFATTYVSVGEAPTETPTETPINFDAINNNTTMSIAAVGVAIIIAIAIAVLLLRKRP